MSRFGWNARSGGRRNLRVAALVLVLLAGLGVFVASQAGAEMVTTAGPAFDTGTYNCTTAAYDFVVDGRPDGVFGASDTGGVLQFSQFGSDLYWTGPTGSVTGDENNATNGERVGLNALGYDSLDNYLYALLIAPTADMMTGDPLPPGTFQLVKIDSDGNVSNAGTFSVPNDKNSTSAIAAMGAPGTPTAGIYFLSSAGNVNEINIGDGTNPPQFVSTTPMVAGPHWTNPAHNSDWTYDDGYLWSMGDAGANNQRYIARVNPFTGEQDSWPAPAGVPDGTGAFGAVWTFGSGDLGFKDNDNGVIYQVSVAKPSANASKGEDPGFALVRSEGSAVGGGLSLTGGNDDGASCQGPAVPFSISKTAPAKVDVGGKIDYTVTLTNWSDTAYESGWVMTDKLPADVTGITNPTIDSQKGTCSVSGQTITCSDTNPVGPAGASPKDNTVTISYSATAPNKVECIDNKADVDPNQAEDTTAPAKETTTEATAETCVQQTTDVTPTKKLQAGQTLVPGQDATYEIDLTNTGANDTGTYQFSDTLPAGESFVSSSGSSSTCAPDAKNANVVDCSVPNVAHGGGTAQVLMKVHVAANAAVTNQADLNHPVETNCISNFTEGAGIVDNYNGPATVCTTDPLNPQSNVTPTKTAGKLIPGDDGIYTINLSNSGPSDSGAYTFHDDLPAGETFVPSGSGSGTYPGCVASATVTGEVDCSVANIAAGDFVTVPIEVSIPADAASSQAPTANPTVTNCINSFAVAVGTNTDTTTSLCPQFPLTVQANVDWSKASETSPLVPGKGGTYDIKLWNSGPSDSGQLTFVDDLPAGETATSSSGGACSATTASQFKCTIPNLAAGTTEQSGYTLVKLGFTLPADAGLGTTVVTNCVGGAQLISGTGAPSPNACITTPLQPQVDVALKKTSESTPLVPGQIDTYDVTLSNSGPSDSGTYTFTDTLPAGETLNTAGTDPGCTQGASASVVNCSVANLPAGATPVTVKIAVNVAADAAVTNQADLTKPTLTNCVSNAAIAFGVNSGNTSSCDTEPLVPTYAVSLAKSSEQPALVPGQDGTYDVALTNAGPSDSGQYTFTDALPSGETFIAPGSNSATSQGCTSSDGTNVTCTVADVPANAASPLIVKIGVAVAASAASNQGATATPQVVNCVTATAATLGTNTGETNPQCTTTPLAPQSDVTAVKHAESSPLVPGTQATYDVDLSNSGPSDSGQYTYTDTLPTGETLVKAGAGSNTSADCSPSGANVTCVVPNVAAGTTSAAPETIRIEVNVLADAALTAADPANPKLTNCISNISVAAGTDSGTTQACDTEDLHPQSKVTPTKGAEASPLIPGKTAIYDIKLSNAGPSDSGQYKFTDPLPAGETLVPSGAGSSTDAGCAPDAADTTQVDCTVPNVAANAQVTVKLEVNVLANAASTQQGNANPTITNCISDATVLAGTNSGATSACDKEPLNPQFDLAWDKKAESPVVPGTNATYDIDVTNVNGPSDSGQFTFKDTLPTGETFVAAGSDQGCSAAGQVVTCTVLNVPAGAGSGGVKPVLVKIEVAVAADAANSATTLKNCTSGVTPVAGDNNGSDGACDTETLYPKYNLGLAKSPESKIVPGTDSTYDVNLTNGGPSDSGKFTFTDALPTGEKLVAAGAGSNTDAGCTSADGTNVTCTVANVPADTTSTSPVTVKLEVSVAANVGNGATTIQNCVNNITNSNPDATDTGASTICNTAPVYPEFKLHISKSPEAHIVPGTNSTYDVDLANDGPSDSGQFTFTDTLPAGETLVAAGAGSNTDAGCAVEKADATKVDCTVANVPANTTTAKPVVVKLEVAVAADAADSATTITNCVGNITDANPNGTNTGDASGCDKDQPLYPTFKLGVKKSPEAKIVPGTNSTYDIDFTNDGPSDSGKFTYHDLLPDGETLVAAGSGSDTDPGCVADKTVANQVDCTEANVPAKTTSTKPVVMKIEVKVDADAADTAPSITNIVADIVPTNPNGKNNGDPGGKDPETLNPAADLAITDTAETNPVVSGTQETFDLLVTNNGPSDAVDMKVANPVPDGTSYVSGVLDCSKTTDEGTCSNPAPPTPPSGQAPTTANQTATAARTAQDVSAHALPSVTPACTSASGTVTCLSGVIAPHQTIAYKITVLVNSGTTGNITDTATVTSTTPDPVVSNNSASAVVPTTQQAAQLIVKTAATTPVTPGQDATYTITITNHGPSDATGVQAIDAMPNTLTFVSASPGCVDAGQTVTCTDPAPLPANQSVSWQVTAHVSPDATGTIENQAIFKSNTPPPPGGSTPDAQVNVPSAPQADLSVAKTGSEKVAPSGSRDAYTLTATNHGPSTATKVVVTDKLPKGLTFVSASAGCTDKGQTVTCTTATLSPTAPNNTASWRIVVLVTPSVASTIINTAKISSGTADPTPSNNTATVKTKAELPVISLRKLAGVRSIHTGGDVKYTIVVTNKGKGAATNFSVCDVLPAGTTVVHAYGGHLHLGSLCWTIKSLGAGRHTSTHVLLKIASPRISGKLTNRVVAKGAGFKRTAATASVKVTGATPPPAEGVTG